MKALVCGYNSVNLTVEPVMKTSCHNSVPKATLWGVKLAPHTRQLEILTQMCREKLLAVQDSQYNSIP